MAEFETQTLTKPSPRSQKTPGPAWANAVAAVATDKKGRDVRILRVDEFVDYADYFVFVTAANRRQVQAIAEAVETLAKNEGLAVRVEGYASGWWAIFEAGGVVMHIFQPEARSFYDLDHLWADAHSVAIRKPRATAVRASDPDESSS
ncbi:MAG: ribosome silencing factor [Planctomycetota bacterium]